MARRLAMAMLGLAAAAATTAVAADGAAPRVVVLVTIDTLRADHLASHGYPRSTSPFIDRLASEGVRFETAISSCSTTAPAHASILTGLYPRQHGVRVNGETLVARPGAPLQTLGDAFAAQGYQTGAFGSMKSLAAVASGFKTRDFDYRAAAATVDRVLEWLNRTTPGTRAFLWVHLFDPHMPYLAPPSWVRRFQPADTKAANAFARDMIVTHGIEPSFYEDAAVLADRFAGYDGEIAFTDFELERLFQHMSRTGWNDDALWIVTGDHGEGMGSHGIAAHGEAIYQEQLHVPLVVWSKGGTRLQAGHRVPQLVRHVDLVPTLQALALLPAVPQQLAGRSLVPLLQGHTLPAAPALSERRPVRQDDYSRGWEAGDVYSVQDDRYKYIVHTEGQDQFFDLRRDPLERENLAATPSHQRDAMRAAALAEFKRFAGPASTPSAIDPTTLEELKSLGYVP